MEHRIHNQEDVIKAVCDEPRKIFSRLAGVENRNAQLEKQIKALTEQIKTLTMLIPTKEQVVELIRVTMPAPVEPQEPKQERKTAPKPQTYTNTQALAILNERGCAVIKGEITGFFIRTGHIRKMLSGNGYYLPTHKGVDQGILCYEGRGGNSYRLTESGLEFVYNHFAGDVKQ